MSVSGAAVHSLYVVLLGFSVAGALATGYQLVTARPASFNIFGDGTRPAAVAHVPFLVFAAPFIIVRNAIVGRHPERGNFLPAFLAALIAGCWSLLSGKFVMLAVVMLGLA